jgi:hypothetical protein
MKAQLPSNLNLLFRNTHSLNQEGKGQGRKRKQPKISILLVALLFLLPGHGQLT